MITFKSHSEPLSPFLRSNTKTENPDTSFLGLLVMSG